MNVFTKLSLISYRPFVPQPRYPTRGCIFILLIATLVAVQLHPAIPPWWVRLTVLGLFLWRCCIDHLGWPEPKSFFLWVFAGFSLAAVTVEYDTFFGRDASSVLLMLLIGLKLLEIRTSRDVITIVFLVWWTILHGFLFSQSPTTAAIGIFTGGLALYVLLRTSHSQILGRARLIRDGVCLVFLALPIMLAMYLLFPRIQGALWSIPDATLRGSTGLTDQVKPGSMQHLLLDSTVVFRVEFSGGTPAPEDRYWRAIVLESSDEQSWQRGPLNKQIDSLVMDYRSRPVDYTTTFSSGPNNWLPVLDLPSTHPPGTIARYGYVLESEKTLSNPFRLTLRSYLDTHTGALNPEERRLNLQLSYQPTTRVRDLVIDWQSETAGHRALVDRALRHFRDGKFFYSLSPPPIGNRLVDELLFETREGYCEHYAATFTTLMRIAGIPARLVLGYMGGELNEVGDYMLVRQSDAHAWSEVWLADSGWTRIDPTAVIAPERIRYGAEFLRRISAEGWRIGNLSLFKLNRLLELSDWDRGIRWVQHRWDAFQYLWNQWVMDYDSRRQIQLVRNLGLKNPSTAQLALLLVAVSIILLLFIPGLLSIHHSKTEPVMRAYNYFLKRLALYGVNKASSEGPVDFSYRAIKQLPAYSEQISEISKIYVTARYSRKELSNAAIRIRRLTQKL